MSYEAGDLATTGITRATSYRTQQDTPHVGRRTPNDPPTQADGSASGVDGYAAYKVADSATTHKAWGMGSYCFSNVNPVIVATHAFEVPDTPGVTFYDRVTVSLGGVGTSVGT